MRVCARFSSKHLVTSATRTVLKLSNSLWNEAFNFSKSSRTLISSSVSGAVMGSPGSTSCSAATVGSGRSPTTFRENADTTSSTFCSVTDIELFPPRSVSTSVPLISSNLSIIIVKVASASACFIMTGAGGVSGFTTAPLFPEPFTLCFLEEFLLITPCIIT